MIGEGTGADENQPERSLFQWEDCHATLLNLASAIVAA
jgi:hypothetical protein